MRTAQEEQLHADWLKSIKAGDLIAVRSLNCPTWGPPYFIFEVVRMTHTQGILAPTDSTKESHRFWRKDGSVVATPHRFIEPATAAVLQANRDQKLEYWARYQIQDDARRLTPDRQQRLHDHVRALLLEQAGDALTSMEVGS